MEGEPCCPASAILIGGSSSCQRWRSDSRADLERAVQLLDEARVTHGEITSLPSFEIDVLSFEDPDGVQLELTAPMG
jgi:hypothetical protein